MLKLVKNELCYLETGKEIYYTVYARLDIFDVDIPQKS